MFLDDDDEFLPQKIREQVNCLNNRDSSWGTCYTRYVRKKNEKVVMYSAETREGYLLCEELQRNLFVHAGSNLMLRRSVVEEVNGFDETFQRNQDVEFLVRVLSKYKLAFVDILGLIVNVHPKVINQNFENLTKQYIDKFESYINQLDEKQQLNVMRMLNLQLFRSKIFNMKSFRSGLNMIRTKKVDKLDALIHIMHLVFRKITRRSYGFLHFEKAGD